MLRLSSVYVILPTPISRSWIVSPTATTRPQPAATHFGLHHSLLRYFGGYGGNLILYNMMLGRCARMVSGMRATCCSNSIPFTRYFFPTASEEATSQLTFISKRRKSKSINKWRTRLGEEKHYFADCTNLAVNRS